MRGRIRPDSAVAGAATRGAMAMAAPALAGRGAQRSRPLRRAVRSAALGRPSRDERAWISRIEAWRRELGSDRRMAELLGSGADHPPGSLADAVPWMSIPPVWGRFLMRVVDELRPQSCLELGTGFGVSSAYQAAALELTGAGRLITLDVAADWTAIAERGFAQLGLGRRVELRRGPIDETLGRALEDAAPLGYAFLDADHTEDATVEHFAQVAPAVATGGVVIVDDVRWSEGMRRAWRRIADGEGVAWSARLGRMGAVILA